MFDSSCSDAESLAGAGGGLCACPPQPRRNWISGNTPRLSTALRHATPPLSVSPPHRHTTPRRAASFVTPNRGLIGVRRDAPRVVPSDWLGSLCGLLGRRLTCNHWPAQPLDCDRLTRRSCGIGPHQSILRPLVLGRIKGATTLVIVFLATS